MFSYREYLKHGHRCLHNENHSSLSFFLLSVCVSFSASYPGGEDAKEPITTTTKSMAFFLFLVSYLKFSQRLGHPLSLLSPTFEARVLSPLLPNPMANNDLFKKSNISRVRCTLSKRVVFSLRQTPVFDSPCTLY